MKALTPTAPNELSPADEAAHRASSYVRTVPLPMPGRLVENFDCYGSYWGVGTATETVAAIAEAHAARQQIDEWNVADRAGHQIRIVRIPDPDFLDTISVIPLLPVAVVAA